MNKVLLAVPKRIVLPLIAVLAILIWLGLCKSHYDSYWLGTIYRVQTVDFNLLHHTLPPTLSRLVLSGDSDEIQKVLDSTFGIFGIVVTDSQGSEILFRTGKSYKHETWQPLVSPEFLASISEPYDLLTDPPPLSTQNIHKGPRSAKSVKGPAPGGRVIGRIYYVRGVPPAFVEDLVGAVFSNWFEMSGSKRGYILLTLNILGYSLAITAIFLWRRRVLEDREGELKAAETDIEIRRKALGQLKADLVAQKKKKEWLELESEQSYQRALRLKEALIGLREAFFTAQGGDPASLPDRVNVRPPLHRASELLSDVETLLPELTQNARVLKSQAEVWQTYCAQLEKQQKEMQRMLEQTARRASPEVVMTDEFSASPDHIEGSVAKFS